MNDDTSITSAAVPRQYGNPHVGLLKSGYAAHDQQGLIDLLEITVNRRLKRSWRLRVDFNTGARILSVPPVLVDPPEHIKECLIQWALMPIRRRTRRNSEYVRNRRRLENVIHEYMASKGVPNMRKSRFTPKTFEHLTKGFVFDLQEIFDTLNRVYFGGEIKSCIRWGRQASRTSYQDTRMTKSGEMFNLITISGVYDSPKVPEYAIYGLVYHEMLHIAIPPVTVNGRRIIHGKDFKEAMKRYPYWREWMCWERENMGKLLTNARKRAKRVKK